LQIAAVQNLMSEINRRQKLCITWFTQSITDSIWKVKVKKYGLSTCVLYYPVFKKNLYLFCLKK